MTFHAKRMPALNIPEYCGGFAGIFREFCRNFAGMLREISGELSGKVKNFRGFCGKFAGMLREISRELSGKVKNFRGFCGNLRENSRIYLCSLYSQELFYKKPIQIKLLPRFPKWKTLKLKSFCFFYNN